MSYIEARTMTYSLDQPYLEMPWDSSSSLWLMKQGRKKSAFSEVYGKPWSLSPSNAVCAVHGWCNALISQNTWCQSITHSNRHFGLSTPQWQLLLSTSGFLTRNLDLILLSSYWKWLLLAGCNYPNVIKGSLKTLHQPSWTVPLSLVPCSQGWRRRPVSFLPICKFMPTLCFYSEHLPKITLLQFPVTQSMGIGPSLHSRLCVPLWSCLFVYMAPKGTFSMCSQLFLKFEYFSKNC